MAKRKSQLEMAIERIEAEMMADAKAYTARREAMQAVLDTLRRGQAERKPKVRVAKKAEAAS